MVQEKIDRSNRIDWTHANSNICGNFACGNKVEKYDYSKAVVESIEKLYGEKSKNRLLLSSI